RFPGPVAGEGRDKKSDVLAVSLVGNKVIIEPLARSGKENWQQILEETAGIWPEVDPGYVDELRAAARQRLEEAPCVQATTLDRN
ncbi:MAG: hypothetical protein HPY90_13740, partial [Syntrophothermus sp.]|uniref:hypothetical protein n=1 Tax=Syntrophothermus sp. TaxID=2736299 RepID=UPI00257D84E5